MSERNSQEFEPLVDKILNDWNFQIRSGMAAGDEEMVKIVKSFFNWTPPTSNYIHKFKKSSAKSMKYAEEAMEAGNARQKGRSLKLAYMITAFAQDAGDLALGHFIRLTLIEVLKTGYHQKIKELEFCVKSPQLPKKMNDNITLENNHGQQLSPNLFSRKKLKRMLSQLHQEVESPVMKKCAEEVDKQNEKETKFTRDIFTLKSPNPKVPAVENFVEMKYDSVKGRHLIVTKDVPVGTTLIIEKPVVAGLGNVFELEINRCHYCFQKEFVPIPCPNCVFVLYCSEKCLEESKDFHTKYECAAYPDICAAISKFYGIEYYLCAYLTVCTFGPHQLFQAFQKEQEQSSEKKSDAGFCKIAGVDPETGIFDSSSLYTISHMTRPHQKVCTTFEALACLALTRILELRTDFFEQLESELKSPIVKTRFTDFITLFLIQIRTTHVCNASKEPKYFDEPEKGSTFYTVSLQPTHKLTNHSCQPNFGFYQNDNLKGVGTATVATKDLKKGEELCRSYEYEFLVKPKHLRQALLMKDFHFKCECVACVNDWPLMEKLEAEKDRPKFCCPSCSSKIPPEPKMMSKKNYEKIALNSGNNFICPQCTSEYKEQELLAQFKRNSMALKISENLIKEEEKGEETLKSLKAASTFFQNHLIPPSFYQEKCRKLIGKAIVNTVTDIYD